MLYDIVRYYESGRKRVVKRCVTLEKAQAHCRDPETSWRTCTKAAGKNRTKRHGHWFDGYREHRCR